MPAGTIVASGSLISPSGEQGIPGPNAISSDAGNAATWGSDGKLYVGAVPTGTVLDFSGFTAPLGFLMVDGSPQSRTTYPNLFNALSIQTTGNTTSGSPIISGMGTTALMSATDPISGPGIPAGATISTIDSASQIHISANATATASGVAIVDCPWGVGDGVTTFNLPDNRGRGSVGAGQGTYTGATKRSLSDTGGEETHVLVTGELAAHNHTATSTTSSSQPAHTHGLSLIKTSYFTIQASGNLCASPGGTNAGSWNPTDSAQPAITSTTTTTIANNGSGTAHNNMQPFVAYNKIIKT